MTRVWWAFALSLWWVVPAGAQPTPADPSSGSPAVPEAASPPPLAEPTLPAPPPTPPSAPASSVPVASPLSASSPGASTGELDALALPPLHRPPAPAFVTLDRIDGSSRVSVSGSYISSATNEDVRFARLVVHGRYVDPNRGIGGYATFPLAIAHSSSGARSETHSAVGNLEAGVVLAPRASHTGSALIFHAGVMVPTAESGPTEADTNILATLLATPDLYNALPNTTAVKLGASGLARTAQRFFRLDAGVDLSIRADHHSLSKALHLNAGAGLDRGAGSIMVELQNVLVIPESKSEYIDMINVVALSARLRAQTHSPFLSIAIPVRNPLVSYAIVIGTDI